VRRRVRRGVGRHGRRRAGSVDAHGLRCIAEQICKVGGVDLLGELMYCCVSGGLESIPSELVDACATSVCRRYAVGAIGAGIVSMLAAPEMLIERRKPGCAEICWSCVTLMKYPWICGILCGRRADLCADRGCAINRLRAQRWRIPALWKGLRLLAP
jgi:hypothetical protein